MPPIIWLPVTFNAADVMPVLAESCVVEASPKVARPVNSEVPETFNAAEVIPVEAESCVVLAVVPVSLPVISSVPLMPVLPEDNVVAERAEVEAFPLTKSEASQAPVEAEIWVVDAKPNVARPVWSEVPVTLRAASVAPVEAEIFVVEALPNVARPVNSEVPDTLSAAAKIPVEAEI